MTPADYTEREGGARYDENGVMHVVALSGGHDSTALALLLNEREPRPYNYVCTPTGDELPEMFEHWPLADAACALCDLPNHPYGDGNDPRNRMSRLQRTRRGLRRSAEPALSLCRHGRPFA